jgi:predicted nucleic acid-binding protein
MKLYIETTVPNMLFAEDAPEKRRATTVFFEWMKICRDELYVSALVESELALAPEPKRERMARALRELPLRVLPVTATAEALANSYLAAGIWTPRSKDDAVHVATAVCEGLDVVVSWNMRDLANVRRVARINEFNVGRELGLIRIATPEEVMET